MDSAAAATAEAAALMALTRVHYVHISIDLCDGWIKKRCMEKCKWVACISSFLMNIHVYLLIVMTELKVARNFLNQVDGWGSGGMEKGTHDVRMSVSLRLGKVWCNKSKKTLWPRNSRNNYYLIEKINCTNTYHLYSMWLQNIRFKKAILVVFQISNRQTGCGLSSRPPFFCIIWTPLT